MLARININTCLLCGMRYKLDSKYGLATGELCADCHAFIRSLDRRVETSHATRRWGYVRLLLAIRRQAQEDRKLHDWETFWIEPSDMQTLWNELREYSSVNNMQGTRV